MVITSLPVFACGIFGVRRLIADEEFLTIFLAFYRKFAAPSKLLHSLIAKYEEGSRSAIDYMLKMIVQTRYK
jgi:hypothetical protein